MKAIAMHTLRIPKAARGLTEVVVGRWHKSPGDNVAKGDILVELEAPGLLVELTADVAGALQTVLLTEGQVAQIDAPLCVIGEAGKNTPNTAAPATEATAQPGAAMLHAVVPVLMPQAGQSMEEGTIVAWHAKVGSRVKVGDVLFEVETDKATIEVEAVEAGRLSRIVVEQGQTASVKVPVAYLAENDADVDAFLAASAQSGSASVQAQPKEPAAQTTPARDTVPSASIVTSAVGRAKASPYARKLANERGVQIDAIRAGSGPGGRIVSADVLSAVASASAMPAGEPVHKRFSAMRKAIARNLSLSKQTIPHFYMRATVNAGPLYQTYKAAKVRFQCSVNDLVLLAVAKTVAQFPAFRSRLDGDGLLEFPSANIGVAVGLENGLVVPVIVGADRMNLQQLALRTRQVVESARGGKIEGHGQGVMTITNLGMFGVEEFSAIINPPEASILAVGAIREDVVVQDGAIRPAKVMSLTLSADHRIIDGMLAAQFLAALKALLESPEKLIE